MNDAARLERGEILDDVPMFRRRSCVMTSNRGCALV